MNAPDPTALLAELEAAGAIDATERARLVGAMAPTPELDPRDLVLRLNRRVTLEQLTAASIKLMGRDLWTVPGYALLSRLGGGATGSVYSALRLDKNQLVAVKVLAEHTREDLSTLPRLRRELDVARQLRHEGLPWYGEVGTTCVGTAYYSMELVAARSLADLVERNDQPVDERTAWRVLGRMARVLEHLGQRGVVHRDVKPANILIDERGVWLCDFGLAINPEESEQLTSFDTVVGTPYFMSPEHAFGDRHLKIASDVYSLGATVYYAACCQLAIDGASPVEVMLNHDRQDVIPIRQHRAELSPALEKLLQLMLEKQLEERPAPAQVAEVAEAWLDGGPSAAWALLEAPPSGRRGGRVAGAPAGPRSGLLLWHVLVAVGVGLAVLIAIARR